MDELVITLMVVLLAAAITLSLLYLVVKAAVRNGINESLLFADEQKWAEYRNINSDKRLPIADDVLLFKNKQSHEHDQRPDSTTGA